NRKSIAQASNNHETYRLIMCYSLPNPQPLVSGSNLITILFWNIAKNPLCLEHLPCLAKAHEVDVFILAECPDSVNLGALNAVGKGPYQPELNANAKVQAITRLNSQTFIHRYTSLGRE